MGCHLISLLPARTSPQPRLPWQVHRRTQAASAPGQARVPRLAQGPRIAGTIPSVLRQLFFKDWVVYTEPPFGGAEHVLQYLARYTHRVAISNHRLVSFKDDRVSFRWKDYAAGSKQKIMTVSVDEFLRRFLIHVLPKGLVRIRHFGLFANRKRSASLLRCRFLLKVAAPPPQPAPTAQIKCPLCSGLVHVVERITSFQLRDISTISPPKPRFDSS
jgi:hypothetical protein